MPEYHGGENKYATMQQWRIIHCRSSVEGSFFTTFLSKHISVHKILLAIIHCEINSSRLHMMAKLSLLTYFLAKERGKGTW